MTIMDRRKFLYTAATGLAGAATLTAFPGLATAALPTDKRLIVVLLRGGMDGLAAVPPLGDKDYAAARGKLALTDGLPLDGFFALHPALAPLHALYKKKELTVFHGIASPYRERSHFDGQNLLENGTDRPNGADSGWLNRTLASFPDERADRVKGLAIGQNVPLILYGKQPVASWAPSRSKMPDSALLDQLERIYDNDALFHNALAQGLAIHEIADEALSGEQKQRMKNINRGNAAGVLAAAASKLLQDKNGARIATVDVGGWDSHARQGTSGGSLANNLKGFAQGVEAFTKNLAPIWDKTAVLVVTEFGRTVHENGTGGTDHGTASAAFLMGGAVNGGQIYADWKGLDKNSLYQNRDLMPTTDMRALFKSVLRDHLGIPLSTIENVIFPGSRSAGTLSNLIRKS
jgi:uncharacterized protein (DUF1501 family)